MGSKYYNKVDSLVLSGFNHCSSLFWGFQGQSWLDFFLLNRHDSLFFGCPKCSEVLPFTYNKYVVVTYNQLINSITHNSLFFCTRPKSLFHIGCQRARTNALKAHFSTLRLPPQTTRLPEPSWRDLFFPFLKIIQQSKEMSL